MKTVSLFALILMSITMVSCGDKDKSKSSNSFTSALSTKEGYYNIQAQTLEVGGQSYPFMQYAHVIQPALQQASMARIPPVMVNGVQKLRARVTAQLLNQYNNQFNNQYNQYNQYNNQYNQQSTLNIQQVVFY